MTYLKFADLEEDKFYRSRHNHAYLYKKRDDSLDAYNFGSLDERVESFINFNLDECANWEMFYAKEKENEDI